MKDVPTKGASVTAAESASLELVLYRLESGHEVKVLQFLQQRPTHTFALAGLVRDNGLVSSSNRGSFFGCADRMGVIQGVALIGHATMFEARSDAAIELFAHTAQTQKGLHVLLGEEDKVSTFWRHYSSDGQPIRLSCREKLNELRWPVAARDEVPGLRQATVADLDQIVPAHAQMAVEESGINPLDVDPEGFRNRCRRRVELGRTWVWSEGGKLTFKADVCSDTPEVVYLEGIFVDRAERGRGYGLRCLSQLSRELLKRTQSISLLVNEKNKAGQALYQKVGFKVTSLYDTIYLKTT